MAKREHIGRCLNDCLDGTFSVRHDKKVQGGAATFVVSRAPDDTEPIVTPKRPKYQPNRQVAWHPVPGSDVSLSDEGYYVQHIPQRISRPPVDPALQELEVEEESDSESDSEVQPEPISSNGEILFTKSGRRYTEWIGRFSFLQVRLFCRVLATDVELERRC